MENKVNNSYINKEKALSVENLRVSFRSDSGMVYAVRGVSFDLYKGETLCIVGESGSGKSVTSKTIMGILPKNAIIESGQILYEGEDLVRVSEEEFHRIRGHKIGMIFQDPLSSLNPIMKVGKQIIEATMINSNILKKRYNELISKELVAYRNNYANYKYELSKCDNEISLLKKFLGDYKKELKQSKKGKDINVDKSELTLIEKINDHFRKVYDLLDIDISNFTYQLDHISRHKVNNFDEDKLHIYEVNEKIYQKCLNRVLDYKKNFNLDNKDDVISRITNRLNYLQNSKKFAKSNYLELKPLLLLRLKKAKIVAKKDNLEYKTEITLKLKEDLANEEAKISECQSKIEKIRSDLEVNDPNLLKTIDEIIKENELAIKKFNKDKKRNFEINLSKSSSKPELILKDIPHEKYAIYLKEIDSYKKEIEKIKEEFINKTKITKKEAKKMALEVMKEVGIPLPEKRFKQYPFEFSGGMRQRIVIAIALTANPDILICDEPTTALDVTIQAQILELINKLKRERGLSCIFITHDLGVVANMADRVAVMYAGKIVEYGLANEIFFDPKHPYTWALLSSIPDIDSKEKLEAIPGTPPDLRFPPKGDAFALRSKYAMEIDFKYEPPYFKVSDTHYAATWLLYPDAPKVEMPRIVKERINNALKGVKDHD